MPRECVIRSALFHQSFEWRQTVVITRGTVRRCFRVESPFFFSPPSPLPSGRHRARGAWSAGHVIEPKLLDFNGRQELPRATGRGPWREHGGRYALHFVPFLAEHSGHHPHCVSSCFVALSHVVLVVLLGTLSPRLRDGCSRY